MALALNILQDELPGAPGGSVYLRFIYYSGKEKKAHFGLLLIPE